MLVVDFNCPICKQEMRNVKKGMARGTWQCAEHGLYQVVYVVLESSYDARTASSRSYQIGDARPITSRDEQYAIWFGADSVVHHNYENSHSRRLYVGAQTRKIQWTLTCHALDIQEHFPNLRQLFKYLDEDFNFTASEMKRLVEYHSASTTHTNAAGEMSVYFRLNITPKRD